MTGLIKSDAAHSRVKSLQLGTSEFAIEHEPPALTAIENPLLGDIRRLETALAARGAELEEARRQALQEGDAAGFERGKAQVEKNLQALRAGIEGAVRDARESLTALERLAPLLALTALERVLGPGASQAALVQQILPKQLAKLERDSVLHVDVAASDFKEADAASLSKIAQGVSVRLVPEMASGACRIKLRLGALEIGPRQQWESVARTLAGLASPPAGPSP